MRHLRIVSFIALLLSTWCGPVAHSEPRGSGVMHIEWEVKNRFRLFRNEADFQRHVAAARGDGVLAAEQRLERESDGRGWARDTVERLCVDRAGKLLEFCDRDGEREIYLAPRDHRVGVALGGPLPPNEGCSWSFDDGNGPARPVNGACDEEVRIRLRDGRPTIATVMRPLRTRSFTSSWHAPFTCRGGPSPSSKLQAQPSLAGRAPASTMPTRWISTSSTWLRFAKR